MSNTALQETRQKSIHSNLQMIILLIFVDPHQQILKYNHCGKFVMTVNTKVLKFVLLLACMSHV